MDNKISKQIDNICREKQKEFVNLCVAEFYELTTQYKEEVIIEKMIEKNYKFKNIFIKCGIKNLYELSVEYNQFLDDYNGLKTFVFLDIFINSIEEEKAYVCEEEYITSYLELKNKNNLSSKEEVYAYLDLCFKLYMKKGYNIISTCIPSLYKAFPKNFITYDELTGPHTRQKDFYSSFYREFEFKKVLTYAKEYSNFYDLLKTKDIVFPDNFKPYYDAFSKQKILSLLIDYSYGVYAISPKNASLYLEMYNKEGRNPNDVMDDVMYTAIKNKLLTETQVSHLPESVKEHHPDVFLKTDAIAVNEKFYEEGINAEYLKENPITKEYFLHVDIASMFKYSHISCSTHTADKKNIYQILGTYLNKEEILDLMINFGKIFDMAVSNYKLTFPETFTKKEMFDLFDDACRHIILENSSVWKGDITGKFKEKNKDLYISNDAPFWLKKAFYNKNISFSTLADSHNDITDYLIGTNPLFFKHNYETTFITTCINNYDISQETLYKIIKKYGKEMKEFILEEIKTKMDKKDFSKCKQKEKEKELETTIIDVLYLCFINQWISLDLNEEIFSMFNQMHPDLVIDESADKALKNACYHHILRFTTLLNYKEIDIKKKNYPAYFLNKKKILYLKEKLGTDALFDLALKNKHNANVIDTMIKYNEEKTLIAWYQKLHFLPDTSIMLNMNINDSDKLLANARKWSKIRQYTKYSYVTEEAKEALFKASQIFGVFEGDNRGYNTLLDLVFIPKKINQVQQQCLCIEDEYNFNYLSEQIKTQLQKLYNNIGNRNEEVYKNLSIHEKREISEVLQKVGVVLSPEVMHQIFSGTRANYNKEFREFFLNNVWRMYKEKNVSIFTKIERNYKKILIFNAGRKLTIDAAIAYVNEIVYENIERGNTSLASLASKCGYNEEDYQALEKIYAYTKKRTTSSIPRIVGKTEEFVYEIVRLDDPIALVIGEITNCCQELHDSAESAMIHSATDKNGRLFIVKDKKNKIVAQSWIWRNKGTICFDNIEIPEKILKENNSLEFALAILKVYQKAAKECIAFEKEYLNSQVVSKKITPEEKKAICLFKATVGLGYNDIAKAIQNNLRKDTNVVSPIEYCSVVDGSSYLYIDSKEQYILKEDKDLMEREIPSLQKENYFYHDSFEIYNSNMNEEKIKLLEDLLEEDIGFFYDDIFTGIEEEYNIEKENLRVLMNYNFVIVCEEKQKNKINVKDIITNQNGKDEVKEQLTYAFDQLEDCYEVVEYKEDAKQKMFIFNKNRKIK